MTVQPLVLASLLAFLPAVSSMSAGPDNPESLVVESAVLPRHHMALASYYRAQADAARSEAQRHRSLARTYAEVKARGQAQMQAHCNALVTQYEALAREYEALADLHEENGAVPGEQP